MFPKKVINASTWALSVRPHGAARPLDLEHLEKVVDASITRRYDKGIFQDWVPVDLDNFIQRLRRLAKQPANGLLDAHG